MEIRLEKPNVVPRASFCYGDGGEKNLHWIISKLVGGKDEKTTRRVLKWKISGNPEGNPSMESKIIKFRIILLYKIQGRADRSNLLDYHSLFYLQTTRTFGQVEHLHFPNTFLYFFHSYDVTSLGNINPITYWKYTKHPMKVQLKISTCSFETFAKFL